MSDATDTITAAGEMILDPFAFHPNERSAIGGLGGELQPNSPGYALHTNYVRVAEGSAIFTLRFQGLTARTGSLMLRVHILDDRPPPRVLVANTVRIQLNRLVQVGGEVSLRFEGMRGVRFGLYGGVLGESDAKATGLEVTLDRPALDDGADDALAVPLRNTEFGTLTAHATPLLLATGEPTLAHPVSQLATRSQLAEPVFADWAERLGGAGASARATWGAAFVLQTIRAYGMWREGARGLGFGGEAAAIARVLGAAAISAETATLPDSPDQLPGALGDVDFLWSIDATARSGLSQASSYVERLQRCLRPGGLAVHVLPFVPGREQRPETPATAAFRRSEIERLALAVIGRSEEVAQLKIDGRDPLIGDTEDGITAVGAFGLVIRKAKLRDG